MTPLPRDASSPHGGPHPQPGSAVSVVFASLRHRVPVLF